MSLGNGPREKYKKYPDKPEEKDSFVLRQETYEGC